MDESIINLKRFFKMKVLPFILCLSIFSMTSCSSDDDNDADRNPVTEPFFVRVNGQDFNAVTINATFVGANTIAIEGIDPDDKNIVLGFTGNLVAGAEFRTILNSTSSNIFTPIYDSEDGGFFATSGLLTIISHDENTNEISGRFSFSGEDPNNSNSSLNFTDGEFSVVYEDR